MPRPLSLALCGLIKSDLQNGCDLLTLKSRHRISDKKARTMKKLFDETGEVYTLHKRKGSGRPTKLKPEHVEALKGFLAQHPEALLKDMCLFMELEYQLELTESTMQRCCKKYVIYPNVQLTSLFDLKSRARPPLSESFCQYKLDLIS